MKLKNHTKMASLKKIAPTRIKGLTKLNQCEFYYGKLSQKEAHQILLNHYNRTEDDCFLIHEACDIDKAFQKPKYYQEGKINDKFDTHTMFEIAFLESNSKFIFDVLNGKKVINVPIVYGTSQVSLTTEKYANSGIKLHINMNTYILDEKYTQWIFQSDKSGHCLMENSEQFKHDSFILWVFELLLAKFDFLNLKQTVNRTEPLSLEELCRNIACDRNNHLLLHDQEKYLPKSRQIQQSLRKFSIRRYDQPKLKFKGEYFSRKSKLF